MRVTRDLLCCGERDRLAEPGDAGLVLVLIQGGEALEGQPDGAGVRIARARCHPDRPQQLGVAGAPREPAGGQGRLKGLEQRIPRQPGVERLQGQSRVEQ